MPKPERLYTLDAMRGVAAIVVVIFHMKEAWAPHGALAVDFFFALSGVVIARAYDPRLLSGLPALTFMKQRIIRLYPMFAVGLGLMFLRTCLRLMHGEDIGMSVGEFGLATVLNAAFLPAFFAPDPFALNLPAWSLFYELAVNLVFATALLRLANRRLAALIVFALLGYILSGLYDAGPSVTGRAIEFADEAPRVVFGFTLGVLIQRSGVLDRQRSTAWVLAPLAALTLALLFRASPPPLVYECAFLIVGLPVLIIAGGRLQPPPPLRGSFEGLGDLSYPLYAVHYPLLAFAAFLPGMAGQASFVGVAAALAYALGRWVDPFARRWLTVRVGACLPK